MNTKECLLYQLNWLADKIARIYRESGESFEYQRTCKDFKELGYEFMKA